MEPTWLREFCLHSDMPFKACKPPRSPHDWLQTAGQSLTRRRRASDESVPLSKRIRAGQNQIAMPERPRAGQRARGRAGAKHRVCPEELEEPTGTFAQTSSSRSVHTGLMPRSWKSCSQTVLPSTCPKRQKGSLEGLQTSMRKNARPHEYGGLDDRDDPVTETRSPAKQVRVLDGGVGRHFRCGPQHWGE